MYRILSASWALIGVLALAGCGGSSSGDSGNGATSGTEATGGATGGSSTQAATGGNTPGTTTASPNPAGGFPASPIKHKGDPITIVMIPKHSGIAYFNACQKGAEEAASSLPGVKFFYQGPTEGNSQKQIQIIDSWIVRKPDVIAVSCNNPDELAPSLKRARQKGIHVITWDADANATKSGREFFINQATPEAIGDSLVDVMAKEVGPSAETIVITSTLTAPNQSEWLKYMREHIAQKYPQMKIDQVYPSEEDQQKAFQRTQDALKAYPQVKGIWGISSTAFPGAADAVKQAHSAGKVAVTGLATPQSMKSFVDAGVVKTVVLWNPLDLGYLTIYTANALVTGALKPGDKQITAGRLGNKVFAADQVLLGTPMLFTKDNIGKFNF